MRTAGGELVPETGLFVNIRKTETFYDSSSKRLAKNTSNTSALETISENPMNPEASINPIAFKKLQRQREMDEEESLVRRTLSSPPSLTSRGDSQDSAHESPKRSNIVEVNSEFCA